MEIVNNTDTTSKSQTENDTLKAELKAAQTGSADPTTSSKPNNPQDSDSESDNYYNDFNIKRFSNKTDH